LRDNILKHNLDDVKLLLDKEWKSSGKHWDDFIKDYDAHHVIPVDLLDKSEGLVFYYNNGGKFKFNSIENGIFVKKVSKGGQHAKHPKYTEYVLYEIENIYNVVRKTNQTEPFKVKQFESMLNNFTTNLKREIYNNSLTKKLKINNLYQ